MSLSASISFGFPCQTRRANRPAAASWRRWILFKSSQRWRRTTVFGAMRSTCGLRDSLRAELLRRLQKHSIRRAVRRLPAHERMVVYLRYQKKFTLAEIVELLDVPLQTVYSRLTSAAKHLRTALQDWYEHAPPPSNGQLSPQRARSSSSTWSCSLRSAAVIHAMTLRKLDRRKWNGICQVAQSGCADWTRTKVLPITKKFVGVCGLYIHETMYH